MPRFSGAATGAFPGAIDFEWIPDPEVIAKEILAIAEYLDNMQVPLHISQRILIADMRERFETETTPEGAKWMDWADTYAPYALAYPNAGILRQDLDLVESATSYGAWPVTEDSIFLNTGDWPQYWIWHQEGTGGGAAFFRFGSGELARGEPGEKDVRLTGRTGLGRGKALPARPFVGPSFEAQLEVIETFEAWFEGGATWGRVVPGATAFGGGPVLRGKRGFISTKRLV